MYESLFEEMIKASTKYIIQLTLIKVIVLHINLIAFISHLIYVPTEAKKIIFT